MTTFGKGSCKTPPRCLEDEISFLSDCQILNSKKVRVNISPTIPVPGSKAIDIWRPYYC